MRRKPTLAIWQPTWTPNRALPRVAPGQLNESVRCRDCRRLCRERRLHVAWHDDDRRNGLRETFAGVLWQLPGAVFTTTSVTEAGDVVLLEWGLEAASATATDGIDTFVISEGLIRLQTARLPPVPL